MFTAQRFNAGAGHTRALFESALVQLCAAAPGPQAIFDSADDTLVLANPAFTTEFGCVPSSRAAFERSFEPVATTSADSTLQEHESEGGRRVEVFCPRTSRWYLFHWSRLRAPDGSLLVMLNAQNLTERMDTMKQQRALQEQLLSSSRVMSVGEMATTLAHEINQPLATVVNCLTAARTLFSQRAIGTQRLRMALDLAYEQAEQAAAVVARLREFVKTREPRREPVSLRSLVEHVVQLQQLDAQKYRVRVQIELDSGLPQVLVDRVMVEQVLTNLLRNGIEAMRTTRPADRQLRISARLDIEGKIAVRVADRGSGISPAEEAQLFTPFFTTKANGMGIGLAICRSIIEYHEGHLYFERNPQGGAVFTFTLQPASAS
jgi:C4-dicarboxylate-specific signal transduction histidine kinase